MTCPTCGTSFEGRFCPSCGTDTQPWTFVCRRCGASFYAYACPACGLPLDLEPPSRNAFRSMGSVVWTMGFALFLVLAVANLVALAYSAYLVVQGAVAGGPRVIDLFLLLPYPVGMPYDVSAAVFCAYFGLIVTAIVAAYLLFTFRDGPATKEALTRPLAQFRARFESRSAWIGTAQMFLALTFLQMAYVLVLYLAGLNPTAPEFPPSVPGWYQYYALANASVYEEIVTRLLFLGFPVSLVALLTRGGGTVAGRTIPAWRHLFGGTVTRDSPRPLLATTAVFGVLSAAIFGLAHVPSWGWWKFPPTLLGGFGMAYVFARHGILASILVHFSTNFMGALALLTGDSLAAQFLVSILILFLVGFGFLFLAWYAPYGIALANHVLVRFGLVKPRPVPVAATARFSMPGPTSPYPPPYPPPPPPPPPPYAYVPPPPAYVPGYGQGFAPFVCTRCGWREARYDAGRLTCLRCGHASP